MNQNDRYRKALAKIAEMSSAIINGEEDFDDSESTESGESEQISQEDSPGCVIRTVPRRLLVKAAKVAAKINPMNAPVFGPVAALGDDVGVMGPLQISVMITKYWGRAQRTLSVSFMETTSTDLKSRIISHLNAWSKCGGIKFAGTNGTGDVRISRGPGGYYSYLGVDILLIPKSRQTMNLEGFTMSTPESEYKRVVRHEAGHTLGFPHEHARKAIVARIDPPKAYKWFLDTYGWDQATVDAQVLTPLDEATLMGTPPDQTSIMCYQLPGSITTDGKPILGGTDINGTDCGFAGNIYPKAGRAMKAAQHEEDWAEAEDVEVPV